MKRWILLDRRACRGHRPLSGVGLGIGLHRTRARQGEPPRRLLAGQGAHVQGARLRHVPAPAGRPRPGPGAQPDGQPRGRLPRAARPARRTTQRSRSCAPAPTTASSRWSWCTTSSRAATSCRRCVALTSTPSPPRIRRKADEATRAGSLLSTLVGSALLCRASPRTIRIRPGLALDRRAGNRLRQPVVRQPESGTEFWRFPGLPDGSGLGSELVKTPGPTRGFPPERRTRCGSASTTRSPTRWPSTCSRLGRPARCRGRSGPSGDNESYSGLYDSNVAVTWRFVDELISNAPSVALRVGAIIAGAYDTGYINSLGDGGHGIETSLVIGRFGSRRRVLGRGRLPRSASSTEVNPNAVGGVAGRAGRHPQRDVRQPRSLHPGR